MRYALCWGTRKDIGHYKWELVPLVLTEADKLSAILRSAPECEPIPHDVARWPCRG